jgi:hypothetical protein
MTAKSQERDGTGEPNRRPFEDPLIGDRGVSSAAVVDAAGLPSVANTPSQVLTSPTSEVSGGPKDRGLALDLMRCMWRAREADASVPRTDAAAAVVASMLEENAHVLRQIMKQYGWPGYKLVGERAAQAAWHIAHYCPDIGFQAEALQLLGEAVRAGDADPEHYALLADRLCAVRSQPQRFGTQYVPDGAGGLALYAVVEPRRLDDRRSAWGLEPHAEWDARIRGDAGLVGFIGPRRP